MMISEKIGKSYTFLVKDNGEKEEGEGEGVEGKEGGKLGGWYSIFSSLPYMAISVQGGGGGGEEEEKIKEAKGWFGWLWGGGAAGGKGGEKGGEEGVGGEKGEMWKGGWLEWSGKVRWYKYYFVCREDTKVFILFFFN